MELTRGFYLTLPSDSSSSTYPNNTPSSYKVKLPQRVRLKGENWMVGLVQVDYSNTLFNIPEDDGGRFYYDLHEGGETFFRTGLVSPGHWDSISQIIEAMNKDIAGNVLPVPPVDQRFCSVERFNFADRLVFSYDTAAKKVTANIKDGASVYFPIGMATLLGFQENVIVESTTTAPSVADLTSGKHAMFVYSDIASRVLVGDAFAPLLRTLPIRGSYGAIVTENFENVHYIPVASNEFESVEIDISFSTGERIPFQSGKAICKLHFTQYSDLNSL